MPNPSLMIMLSVFKAFFDVKDMKMNVDFKVEVLCKNFSVQHKCEREGHG